MGSSLGIFAVKLDNFLVSRSSVFRWLIALDT
jgi:hypothetical protein